MVDELRKSRAPVIRPIILYDRSIIHTFSRFSISGRPQGVLSENIRGGRVNVSLWISRFKKKLKIQTYGVGVRGLMKLVEDMPRNPIITLNGHTDGHGTFFAFNICNTSLFPFRSDVQ